MVHITRTQSRVIAILTLILFMGLGVFMVRRNPGLIQKPIFPSGSSEEVASAGFLLNKFHRTETKGGKKLWEVTADTGEYFSSSDSARLSNAFLVLYQKNGDVVEVRSNKALLHFTGNTLLRAELSESVKMNVNKTRFVTTDKADYNKPEDSLFAPGYARIEDEKMILEGESLRVKLSAGDLSYEKNVKSRIKATSEQGATTSS